MFPVVEFKAMTLDYGIPGVSPSHMLLFFLVMFAVAMIPYLFLYRSLRDQPDKASKLSITKPIGEFLAVHAHQHPEPLRH